MITIIKLQELFASLAARGMQQVFSDWEMLVGFEAHADPDRIQLARGVKDLGERIDPRHVVIETKVECDAGVIGPIYFAFPNTLVVEIIAELLMIPESARKAKAFEGLSENDVAGFQEMANLLCGSWNRVFQDLKRSLRISQSVEDLRVWTGGATGDSLIDCVKRGRLAFVPFPVTCTGSEHPSLIVMPFEVTINLAKEFYGEEDAHAA